MLLRIIVVGVVVVFAQSIWVPSGAARPDACFNAATTALID